MEELGMPSDRIFLGYDAVDNRFFSEEARKIGVRRWEMGGEKQPCFLASARFIEKKNLFRLLRAYARYREEVKSKKLKVEGETGAREGSKPSTLDFAGPAVASHLNSGFPKPLAPMGAASQSYQLSPVADLLRRPSTVPQPWPLVLLGDGGLREELEKLRSELGLEDCVQMPGFKQYEELPSYYAYAGAFIHASTTEQWGLVVNEAMASGLPVLVSNRCGCARDLVKDGENGWTFDPSDEEQMAELMLRISSDEERRKEMSARSREIITEWGPERFASGVKAAVEAALSAPKKKVGLIDRLILWAMTRR
jgi:glycosyltransferase involved in cell wall biosynthesis